MASTSRVVVEEDTASWKGGFFVPTGARKHGSLLENHASNSRDAAKQAARIAADSAARGADLRARLALALSPSTARAATAMAAKGRAMSNVDSLASEVQLRSRRLKRVLGNLADEEEAATLPPQGAAWLEADRLRGALAEARQRIADIHRVASGSRGVV